MDPLWRVASVLEWYACNSTGAVLANGNSRCNQTALARFLSEHLFTQCHMLGITVFPAYPKCTITHMDLEYIFTFIECQKS